MISKLKTTSKNFYNWSVRYNAEKTAMLYHQIDFGCAESCTCEYCREFIKKRQKLFPRDFISILECLGINPVKEMEVFFVNDNGQAGQCYKGWFHFVGFLKNLNYNTPEPAFVKIADNFEILFTLNIEMPHPVFMKYPLVQIEFKVILSEMDELLLKF